MAIGALGCLLQKVEKGIITHNKEYARAKYKKVEKLADSLRAGGTLTEEEVMHKVLKHLKRVEHANNIRLAHDLRRRKLVDNIFSMNWEYKNVQELMKSLLIRSVKGIEFPVHPSELGWVNTQSVQDAIKSQFAYVFKETLEKYHDKLTGRPRIDLGEVTDIIYEPAGADLSKYSKESLAVAKGIEQAAKLYRGHVNRRGGMVNSLKNWMPRDWSAVLLPRTKEAFVADILPRLNLDKMLDWATGARMGETKAKELLEKMYDDIRGNNVTYGDSPEDFLNKPILSRLSAARTIVFKSAEDEKYVQRTYSEGQGDLFLNLVHWVEGVSRDIAIIETLGTSPGSRIKDIVAEASKAVSRQAQAAQKKIDDKIIKKLGREPTPEELNNLREKASGISQVKALFDQAEALRKSGGGSFGDIWRVYSGWSSIPRDVLGAETVTTIENVAAGTIYGSAAVSALPLDSVTMMVANNISGLPRTHPVVKSFQLYLNPWLRKQTISDLLEIDFVLENWMSVLGGQSRFQGDFLGAKGSRWYSDRMLRLGTLVPWTDASYTGHSLTAHLFLNKMAKTAFEDLPKEIQITFGRYGITPKDWFIYRTAAPREVGKHKIPMRSLVDIGQKYLETASKFTSLIRTEREIALPQSTVATRAALRGSQQLGGLGSISGIMRLALFAKTVPAAIVLGMLGRLGEKAGGKVNPMTKGANWGLYILGTLIGGAVSQQIYEISRGRTPAPMWDFEDNPQATSSFWINTMLRAGTFGAFQDIALGTLREGVEGGLKQLTGPVFSRLLKPFEYGLFRYPYAKFVDEDQRKADIAKARAIEGMTKLLPFNSIPFAGALVIDKMLSDTLIGLSLEDPDVFWDKERKRMEKLGQTQLLEPGQVPQALGIGY